MRESINVEAEELEDRALLLEDMIMLLEDTSLLLTIIEDDSGTATEDSVELWLLLDEIISTLLDDDTILSCELSELIL